jgi:hypothetical protein
MVVSQIDDSISYPEIKSIMVEDRKKTVELFLIEIHSFDIVSAIGNQIDTYKSKQVAYHPVYMIKNNGKAVQIGVYELSSSDVISFTDENSNLDIERLGVPLIYTFVTKSYIDKNRMIPPDEEEKLNTKEDISDNQQSTTSEEKATETPNKIDTASVVLSIPSLRSDIFSLDTNAKPPNDLQEETSEDAERERNAFAGSEQKSTSWIQKAMKNMNYHVHETENTPDSLFECVRLAFSQIGQITTVSALRKKLSNEVDQELLDNYTNLYRTAAQTALAQQKNAKNLEKDYEKFKGLVTNTISSSEQGQHIENAKIIAKQHGDAVSQKRNAQDLYNEVKFMKNVDTIEKLIAVVQSSEFWADTWTLSTLERILNIKFVVLSSEHAKQENDNMLQCGSVDPKIKSNGVFDPEFYILVENTGLHYRILTYKNKHIFKYTELPYDIKNMIVTKCIERNSGLFVLIPNFRSLSESIDAESLKGEEQVVSIDMLTKTDPSIVFQFYDKSMDKPPGKGSGEKIEPPERRLEFAKLSAKGEFPNWRRKLDNTWMDEENPIKIDDYTWNSVEHYIQANKFKTTSPTFYADFTAESKSDLSTDVDMALGAGSKNGKNGKIKARPDDATIDPEYPGKKENDARMKAMTYKFTEVPHYKGLLRATKNATLNKFVKGYPPKLDTELITIRNSII